MMRWVGACALLLSLSACNAFDFGLQDDPAATSGSGRRRQKSRPPPTCAPAALRRMRSWIATRRSTSRWKRRTTPAAATMPHRTCRPTWMRTAMSSATARSSTIACAAAATCCRRTDRRRTAHVRSGDSGATVTAAVLIIGNEILSGRTQDVNLAYLAKRWPRSASGSARRGSSPMSRRRSSGRSTNAGRATTMSSPPAASARPTTTSPRECDRQGLRRAADPPSRGASRCSSATTSRAC